METVGPKAKRQRRNNFSDKENDTLINAVKSRIGLLKASSKIADVCKKKRVAWQEVADAVNAVGGCGRTADSVKKR